MGGLAALFIRTACGDSTVEVSEASHIDWFLRVFDHISEFRRDARASLFLRRATDIFTSNCVRSTTQFVCIGAFQARISDPLIGGTYITVSAVFFLPWFFLMSNHVSFLTLFQISGPPGLDSLFYEVQYLGNVRRNAWSTDVQIAIDYFTIATCQVGDNGTSLTANGASMKASASML